MPEPNDPTTVRAWQDGVLQMPLHAALELRFADPHDPTQGILLPVTGLAVNREGLLHGGLVPALLDVSAYLTVLPHLPKGTNAVTHSTQASLARGVPEGGTVHFRGHVDRVGRTLVFCGSTAHHEDRLVATGSIVKSVVPLPGA